MAKSATYACAEDAENAFYSAFQKADLHAMMEVWGPDGEVVCIHPGGPRLDKKLAIQESWDRIFSHDSLMQFSLADVRHMHGDNLAVHFVKEEIRISGMVRGVILATNIYRRFDVGWLMILHHASSQPEHNPAIGKDGMSSLH